ncbi:MAG: cytochrome oxidase subunit III [Cyclobacteriaceae bacterium]|nr:cytochrome oxidase subunit III [Cyclobacteriaceae bacterium]
MVNQELHIENPKPTLSMHPQKFALWLFIVSIVMLFAALTSAYIVKQADGNWLSFQLPGIFAINTVIIALSSLTMHLAYLAAKRDDLSRIRWMLLITVVLGLLFLVGQYISWAELVAGDVYFVSNYASGSFIYIFTGLHAVHLISGIVFLFITFWSSVRLNIHSKNMVRIEMCMTYWHFLGGLWLYLYLFLLFNL